MGGGNSSGSVLIAETHVSFYISLCFHLEGSCTSAHGWMLCLKAIRASHSDGWETQVGT